MILEKKHEIILVVLLLLAFFGLADGYIYTSKIFQMVSFVVLFFYFVQYKINNGLITKIWQDKYITSLILCLLANFTASLVNRGQSFWQSFRTPYIFDISLIMFFYYLYHKKISLRIVEKTIVITYFIFLLCFFLQYTIFFPKSVFSMIGVFVTTDMERRFRMMGQIVGFLGYFFVLNKLLVDKKCPIYYYIGLAAGFLFIILLGFRSEVAALILSTFYLFFRIRGFSRKIIPPIILIAVISFFIIQIDLVQEQLEAMISRQVDEQTFDNSDYIRILQLNFFLNDYHINWSDWFFGSGIPSYSSSFGKQFYANGQMYNSLGEAVTLGIYGWYDWGVYGLSWVLGIPTCVLLYGLMFYMIIRKMEKQNIYISAFYLFLLMTSITTIEFYRAGAYVYHAILLYVVYLIDEEKTQNKLLIKKNDERR